MKSKFALLFIFGFSVLSAFESYSQYSQKLEMLDKYIESARVQWQTPGLAVAIVKDGETILSKGYGVKDIQSAEQVDEETIFAICSTTKAMTAAAMAMLIDEEKASWNDRVIEHMPEFILNDPYVTRELRIKDLFTHNTGLGNADFLWATWVYPSDEIFRRMRFLEPSYGFRDGYTYQNIMYAVAGELISRISGISWADFIQTRIFDELKMENSFPTLRQSQKYKNRSTPHHFVNNELTIITDRSADPIGPAGSIWSCVSDMQKWMHFMLDSAIVDGKRLISALNFKELLKPQTIVTENGFYPTQELTKPHWRTYSLGWFQHDYEGRAVSFHTGSLRGTVAIIGLIPDEKLGVYVFGNLDHAELRHAIMYKVFDVFGDKNKNFNWSTELLKLYTSRKQSAEKRYEERMSNKVENTTPNIQKESLIGTFTNELLGEIVVYLQNNQLHAKLGVDVLELRHHNFDTYRATWLDYQWSNDTLLSFSRDLNSNLYLKVIGYSFRKVE